jgi:hypothetical protein
MWRAHPAIDCALALSKEVQLDNVAEIVCLVHPWNWMTLREETHAIRCKPR